MRTILFVCTGNSCRSVMAAEMLKKILGPNDKVEVLSAGSGAMPGMQATDCTVEILKKEGVDATNHRSLRLSKEMIERADLIFTMERFHKDRILRLVPQANGKVYLLREFQKDPGEVVEPEVPDPIAMPMEVYERSFGLIKEPIQHLAEWLKKNGWV